MPKVYVKGEGLEPKAKFGFDLNQLTLAIGRGGDNHLIIDDDASISTNHCEIRRVLGGFVVKDLNSSNGLHFEDERITKMALENAIEFNVGDTTILFALEKSEIRKLAKEIQNPRVYVTPDLLGQINALHNGEIDEMSLEAEPAATPPPSEPVPYQSRDTVEVQPPAPAEKSPPPPVEKMPPANEPRPSNQTARPGSHTGLPGGPASRRTQRPGAPGQFAARQPVKPAGNPALGFVGVLVVFAIGIVGGLAVKHQQSHGSNFFSDLNSGKLKSTMSGE